MTGGASGLGEATVRRLVAGGARVVIVDRDEKRGPALEQELGERARFVKTDVTSADDVGKAIDAATQLGALRVAVSCAGVGWAARTLNKEGQAHDLELFKTVIGINLVGTFNVLRLAAAAMAKHVADATTASAASSSTPRRWRRTTDRSARRPTRRRRRASSG